MVGSPLTLLLGIAVFVACFGAAVGKPMSIDQKIMAAAKDPRMFDLIHIMPNGEMMMMVQLDMLLTPHQYRLMQGNANRRGKRKALIENAPTNDGTLFLTRWPEGQVFYEIIDSFKQNKSMLTVIEQAIEEWERYTCLNFTAEPVKMTMKTRNPKYQDIIGMAEGLSYKDAKLANVMYNCAGRKEAVPVSEEPMECSDMLGGCANWVKAGHCNMKPGTMAKYCKKSCGFCDKGVWVDP
nr:hypothetical protein BaRGS_013624 [Batillaria attramentaria]